MSAEEHATTIRSMFEAFNTHDLDRAMTLVTDDFELIDLAAGLTLRGPEGLRQWFQGFLRAFPDVNAELTNVLVAGDWVVTEHTGRGTHTGPLVSPAGEIPPTGRSIEVQIAEVCRMQDGKLVLLRAYYDSATMLRQLGLLPQPGPTST
jgi:steroid delta-isomerase-like uncharacterized protein